MLIFIMHFIMQNQGSTEMLKYTYRKKKYSQQEEHMEVQLGRHQVSGVISVSCRHVIHVAYCKRGYFRWGKISRKCWQDISRGGNFHDITHISYIKAYGFYFRVGVIFAKKTKA